MIDETELLTLLADLESDRVERTTATHDTDKFSRAVCAFANDMAGHRLPGYLIVGVDDVGTPCGLIVTDQLLQNLAALRSDGNILPLPALTVARFVMPGGEVGVVEVKPSDLPPARYKGQVHVRVGPRRAIASEQEERILRERRVSFASTFDAMPCMDAGLDDLSLGIFDAYRREAIAPEIIRANHRSYEDQLASLRFFDARMDRPTFAGVLMFGKNPRYFLPGAYVQYLRMPGSDVTDAPSDQAEIRGDLPDMLREIDVRIRTGVTTSQRRVTMMRDQLNADYPIPAVRELMMNAIMHRDYESTAPVRFYWFSDRIEIQNSGGLYGDAVLGEFPSSNAYRNPVIAEAMKTTGYVNRFGFGVRMVFRVLEENGNPPPEYEIDRHFVRVTVRPRLTPPSLRT